jgi:two-component system, OmpR family, copper resistance phosphate regulon response regulator CusR
LEKSRILIVEDEPKVAAFIQRGLEVDSYQAEIAADGELGLKRLNEGKFDAMILDINIPHINGFDLCKRVREFDQKVPILMLSALGSTNDKLQGFSVGADDYLVKPFEFEELLARLRAILKRANANVQEVHLLKVADLEMDTQSKRVTRGGRQITLTAKEFSLLELLMREHAKVLSRSVIAEKVWDINFDTGSNIIDLYIFYLRKKIDKDFGLKLIHTLHGMGYVLREEE